MCAYSLLAVCCYLLSKPHIHWCATHTWWNIWCRVSCGRKLWNLIRSRVFKEVYTEAARRLAFQKFPT